ncbi:PTS sugar transporter subunit IIA [Novilysobacter erysipheiresistens]|uniref:PTS sugar transporter subunit IIA n=1 Tax=Novilysobacter erysipheiresistens TaxID=1749332 RepID=A0ABU7YVR9_9GAMM
MPLQQLLDGDRIAILNTPGDRDAVIDAAAPRLATAAVDAATIGASLHAREQLASTAIGHGVAIPHGRVGGLATTRGAFLRLAEPVDFGAADGQPVDLVLAMAVPEHSLQEHLQQLAEVAEQFADAAFRERLRTAVDLAELRRCLLQPSTRPLSPKTTTA